MSLGKYRSLLIKKMKEQMMNWLENEDKPIIENKEVYQFLHSIKGTSGTLELDLIYVLSSKLLHKAEKRTKAWTIEELRDFLFELMELSFEFEHLSLGVSQSARERVINVPLIQLIDDDISILIYLKDQLESKGWMVIASTEADKAIDQYYNMHPDCIIIDINLPKKSGFEVLYDIQQHSNRFFIPKIMCSIKTDRSTRLSAYKMGADDFISKPIDIEEFLIRVERHLERKRIFDQSVIIDELTQAYNRKFLQDSYNRFVSDIARTNTVGTLAIIDLDYFKKINDTYGHIVGDKVLAEFAQFMKKSIRSTDILFRYGGEEFVILFQRAVEAEVKEVLVRMLEGFSNISFKEGEKSFSLTFSAGIYCIEHPDINLQTAIKTADEALYLAKNSGRARIESANKMQIGRAKKVLNISIVDDDALIRSILITTINGMSFDNLAVNVQAYEDGVQFLSSDRLAHPGLHFLILDGIMPVMDGLEILQQVKKITNIQEVHVLMLTGRKSKSDIAQALKYGADDYLTKPFNISELEARIMRLIKRMVR
ncbi:GGDEF domain-containing response regulator [Niallia sp. 03133]|uniref:GGDEF domain-containing response regulator n=1 Tax=Niallia sp. 03133 TaxID=3458060 RepID=UPI0040447B32